MELAAGRCEICPMFARFLLVLWQAVRELVRVRPSFEPVCDRMCNCAFSAAILAQAVFNGSVVPSRQQSVVVQLHRYPAATPSSASRLKAIILWRDPVALPSRRPSSCPGSCVDPLAGSLKGPSFAVGDKVPFGCRLQLGPSRSELGQLPLLGLDPEGVIVRVGSRRGLRLVTQFPGPTGEQSPAGWGPGLGVPLVPFRTHPKRGGGWSGESPVRSLTASSQVISRNRSRELDGGFYSGPRQWGRQRVQ